MISAIVVAAGDSIRMGSQDKLQLAFQNNTMLGTVLNALSESIVDEIIIVINKNYIEKNKLTHSKFSYVINEAADTGLTSSIQRGIHSVNENSSAYMICLADMPLLQKDDYNNLINKFLENKGKVICQPLLNNRSGNPVIFSSHFKDQILSLTSSYGCKPVVRDNQQYIRHFETDTNSFFIDIDTPGDYENLLNRISKS